MQKARLVVRDNITGIKSIKGLMALDGYYESPIEEFDDSMDIYDICEHLEKSYSAKYQHMQFPELEVSISKE